jgi:hypothetical protein
VKEVARLASVRGIQVIKHQVNNHARYRNIQPKWQRPARNAPVPDEVSAHSPVERSQNQGNYYDGENSVTNQDGEVQRANYSLPWKLRGPMVVVISEIRNQEQSGRQYCTELTSSVRLDPAAPDKTKTRQQQDRAGRVKHCVDMGESGYVIRHK